MKPDAYVTFPPAPAQPERPALDQRTTDPAVRRAIARIQQPPQRPVAGFASSI